MMLETIVMLVVVCCMSGVALHTWLHTITPWKRRCLEAEEKQAALHRALTDIIELGKRDMRNPKYDAYFEAARCALLGA